MELQEVVDGYYPPYLAHEVHIRISLYLLQFDAHHLSQNILFYCNTDTFEITFLPWLQ